MVVRIDLVERLAILGFEAIETISLSYLRSKLFQIYQNINLEKKNASQSNDLILD